MCGIAGFNASPTWVEKHINEKTQFAMLEQAWLHNQHRGFDAAGYFRVDKETSESFYRKASQPASDILDDNKENQILSPAIVFGAHTRAATLGDPSDKRNNHPIEYDNLLVTHNGIISNHNKFKNSVPHNMKSQLGQVDSNAIAIALNRVATPYDIENIKNELKELSGSMAIHAVWKNSPGVSLLARGNQSPLVLRFHPDGFFAYASVDDALYGMIDAMGMDPNDSSWTIREMDQFTLVIIENGQPIMWSTYKESGWSPALNQLKFYVQRLINGNVQKFAHETDTKSHWTAHHEDRSLKAAKKAKRTQLIYSHKQGFIENKKAINFPILASLKPWDKITEADLVYENKNASIIYAKYGDIELIIDSDNSKLLDVYNHDRFPNIIRHIEKPKKEKTPDNASFETWLDTATQPLNNPVKENHEPYYLRHKHINPIMGGQKIASLTPIKIKPKKKTKMITNGVITCNLDIIDLDMEITWQNIDQYTFSKHEPMGFLNDIQCDEHKQLYTAHTDPAACDATLLASIAFASCLTDVTLWYRIDSSLDICERPPKTDNKTNISCNQTTNLTCTWEPYLFRQVFIGANNKGQDQVVEVLMGEMCPTCGNKMFIRRLPQYMEWWTGDKRYVT